MSRDESSERVVECPAHGKQGPAYVCRHLNLDEPVGFVEGYDPAHPVQELFQAWCSECDAVLEREGDWNERAEAFAGIRLVCRVCYGRMKSLNRGVDPGAGRSARSDEEAGC